MSHTFVAYIDESGDDGLGKYREPGGRGGASSWLILSAMVFRKQFDLEAVTWRDQIVAKMPDRKSRNLHFAELNHNQKVVAARDLATRPIRALSVVAYKRDIPDGIYTERNQLYFYLTRYLIERISWLCRDMRPRAPEGDGRVQITFSRRGGMSYDDFKSYMQHLQQNGADDIRVHWPVIDIAGIEAQDHNKRASLQLADIIASSVASGVEPDRYGNCESRHAEILRPIIYKRNDNYFSYGMKFYPHHEGLTLTADQQRTVDLFKKIGQPPGP